MTEIITIKRVSEKSNYGALYGAYNFRREVLGTWFCSEDSFAKTDLGVRQKQRYDEMYPEGWQVVCEWEKEND